METIRRMLEQGGAGRRVEARGWVRTVRQSKGVAFLQINDGSTMDGLQVVVEAERPFFADLASAARTGSAVVVEGTLAASPGRGQGWELRAAALRVLGGAPESYPLQKKRHSFEYLREIAHLRMRTNTFGAVMRVRDVAARAIHRFFHEHDFVWLHTPVITLADCEGAGQMFRVQSEAEAAGEAEPFFGAPARLTVSGQLEAEIGALALSRVYTFGPTFRAENSHTSRHLSEFWMVEPEMAFAELDDDVALAEAFLRHLVRAVLEEAEADVAFFDKRIEPGLLERLRRVADAPFARMTYTEAIRALESSGQAFDYPVAWGSDLQSEHERYLTETHVGGPVAVTDYPASIKAFYMYANDDGQTVRAMDVLVPGVGEIIGGSQREDREEALRERIRAMGLSEEEYAWYLELRRFGSAPHAGFGLGFERAIQFLTGMGNIRDVIPFPRTPGAAAF